MLIFLAFSDMTCHLEDTGIWVFSGCSELLDSRETNLGSSNQEASSFAGGNTEEV